MITLSDYWMGRDKKYKDDLTELIIANAIITVRLANELLMEFQEPRNVASGWRPPEINARTPGAAKYSRHMTGEAIDLDDDYGDLDEWCLDNIDVLEGLGLWLEHPAATKGWCHVQTVPPRSGNRVFYP